jgi:hypothetical protein
MVASHQPDGLGFSGGQRGFSTVLLLSVNTGQERLIRYIV